MLLWLYNVMLSLYTLIGVYWWSELIVYIIKSWKQLTNFVHTLLAQSGGYTGFASGLAINDHYEVKKHYFMHFFHLNLSNTSIGTLYYEEKSFGLFGQKLEQHNQFYIFLECLWATVKASIFTFFKKFFKQDHFVHWKKF